MSTGVVGDLDGNSGGYRAAWLVDQWTGFGYARWVALVSAGAGIIADGFESGDTSGCGSGG